MRPSRRMLPVQMPIGVGDGIDIQQPISTPVDLELRRGGVQSFAVNAAIDDNMSDVNSKRSEFPRHRLSQRPQARLG